MILILILVVVVVVIMVVIMIMILQDGRFNKPDIQMNALPFPRSSRTCSPCS